MQLVEIVNFQSQKLYKKKPECLSPESLVI